MAFVPEGSLHILIIDDDDAVRAAMTKAFEHQGWSVAGAADARAGITALSRSDFDAIVCDFILPEREGTSMFEEICGAFPQLSDRVLFVTGWGHDSRARQLLAYTGRPVLEKPVDLDELIRTVRDVAGAA